jgi:hypothetical protein
MKSKEDWIESSNNTSFTLDGIDMTTEHNKKICVNDRVYFDGLVSNVFTSSGKDTYQSVKLYGFVEGITNNSITLRDLSLEWGASMGASATHIELDNDSDIVTIANGNALNLPVVTANIYYGD